MRIAGLLGDTPVVIGERILVQLVPGLRQEARMAVHSRKQRVLKSIFKPLLQAQASPDLIDFG